MVATYLPLAVLICSSLVIGQALLLLAGRRDLTWIAGPVGLAGCCILAWLVLRISDDNLAALVVVGVATAAAALALRGRVELVGKGLVEALPALGVALLAVSVPFIVEGHFGILGTGFNVDMSQHLFAADRLVDPTGVASNLDKQGYPLAPHGLAAALAALPSGDLVGAFTAVTLAGPILAAAAIAAMLGQAGFGPLKRAGLSALAALPYLVASYLAQGAFKELLIVCFLVGFIALAAEWRERSPDPDQRWAFAPVAVLAAGTLYVYSAPGIAWLGSALVIWAGLEVAAADRAVVAARIRRYGLPILSAIVLLGVLAGPELGRMLDFRGQVSSVAAVQPDRTSDLIAAAAESDASPRERYDNSLGNLFGDISPLEGLGIWPTGDFRVQPDGGSVPAVAFYLGAALALIALIAAAVLAFRARRLVLLAAVGAAALIAAAAYLVSTPYTAAKALQVLAAPAALLILRELFDPALKAGFGALGFAFLIGAAGSSALALANAPVGPELYSTSLAKLRPDVSGQQTLILAPERFLEQRHGRDYLTWELRSSIPCISSYEDAIRGGVSEAALEPFSRIVTTAGEAEGFDLLDGLEPFKVRGKVAIYQREPSARAPNAPLVVDPEEPTACRLVR